MPEAIVPQEQMEMFNQRPSPNRMAEAPMEEPITEAPMEEEITDAGVSRNNPRVVLGTLATFLVDLPPEKINTMKSFIMDFPLITDAVSETTQMPSEDLNDLFDAALGNPEANRRLLQKLGAGEEAMVGEQGMPLQREEPSITPRPREIMDTRQASPMATQIEAPPVPMERGGRGLASPQ